MPKIANHSWQQIESFGSAESLQSVYMCLHLLRSSFSLSCKHANLTQPAGRARHQHRAMRWAQAARALEMQHAHHCRHAGAAEHHRTTAVESLWDRDEPFGLLDRFEQQHIRSYLKTKTLQMNWFILVHHSF